MARQKIYPHYQTEGIKNLQNKKLTCEQIANRIYKILKELETKKLDKKFNLYEVNVWSGSGVVHIRYVDYWNYDTLTKVEALEYLKWLEAGNIGNHYDMEREKK
jgi:hypothetical protein